MMHVLFLASYYPNRLHKLKGIFIQRHALALSSLEKVTVLSAEPDVNMGFRLLEIKHEENGPLREYVVYYNHRNIGIPFLKNLISFLAFILGLIIAYVKITKQRGKVDKVHLNGAMPVGLFALLLKWVIRKPYVLTEHGSNLIYSNFLLLSALKKRLLKVIIRNARIVTGVTHFHANEIKKCSNRGDVQVLENSIEKHGLIRNRIPVAEERERQLCHVSTLSDEKRVKEIISACKVLKEKGIGFKLNIIGGDESRVRDHQLFAAACGVSENIRFFGWLEHTKMLEAISQFDVFILNSKFETFCVAIVEALSCGLPVVAPRLPALEEFVEEEHGVLFDEEKELLSNAILTIINRFDSYDPDALKEYVEKRFSPNELAKKIKGMHA